jgi:DNA-binding PadR family transcriptional regulator
MVMRSAPLEYKYKQDNIPGAIAKAISEGQNERGRMYYRQILSRVEQLLHHSLSDRQLTKYLSKMVNEELLNRHDPTGKRGSKVYFSLTEKGQKKYGLKILGTNIEAQRRKRLYCLLFFFEVYKRTPLLTEKQLSRFRI